MGLNKEITELRNNGHTFRSVSLICNISKSAACNIYHRKWKTFKKKTGPKPKINKRLSSRIKRHITLSNSIGEKVIIIINSLDLDIKRRTLNDWLKKKDFIYSKCAQQINLQKLHKIKRLEICEQWLNKNIDWNNMAFTDEKAFSLDGPDNW